MKRRILNNMDASNFEETLLRDNATTDVDLRPGWFLDTAPYTLMVSMWFHIKPARAENIAIFVFIWALGCTRIFQAVAKSETWDAGTWDLGTRGRGDVGTQGLRNSETRGDWRTW